MTHQDLLNEWADAKIGLHYESSGGKLEKICKRGIEYAKANGLHVPERIIEEVNDRALEDWDDEHLKWKELQKSL